MSELKECPFCGIKQLTDEEAEELITYIGQTRVCDNCGATAKDWNTRPLEDALQSRIAELEKAYMKIEDELDDLLLEREIETAKLKVQIAELENLLDGDIWKSVDVTREKIPVAYVGVPTLRWQPEWGKPTIGFYQVSKESEDE